MTTTIRATALAAAFAVLIATAADAQDRPEFVEPRVYSAAEVVQAVAEAPTRGLPGQFAFIVRGGGRDGGRLFLNSEVDYRDAGTLTVAVDGPVAAALTEQLGGPPEQRLIGRTIVVQAVARRVRIDILANGLATGRFYTQTHVPVSQPQALHVVPGPAAPVSFPARP